MEAYKSMKVSEKSISEDHFDVGDKVKCTKTGKVGKVVKTDAEQKGEYYSVEIDGKVSKFAPDCLVKESLEEGFESLDESKKLLDRYVELKAKGKKDHNIIDIMMSDSSFKRFSRDKMAKIIGDALRSGKISRPKVKEDVELGEGSCKSKKEELDAVNDKENDKKFKDRKDKDIDNDGDVDSSDEYLHKKRKATDDAIDAKKEAVDAEGEEVAPAPKKKEKVVDTKRAQSTKDIKHNDHTSDKKAEISKIESVDTREAFIAMWSQIEEAKDPKKGATAPEEIDSKESPKSKEFIAKHKQSDKKIEDAEEEGRDVTFKAGGKTMKQAGARNGTDNLANGDKSPVKGK